jgi:hypothetical protein
MSSNHHKMGNCGGWYALDAVAVADAHRPTVCGGRLDGGCAKAGTKGQDMSRLSAVRDQPGGILGSVQHHLSVAFAAP